MTPDRATRRKRRRIRLAIRRTSALAAAIAFFFAWGTIGAIETDAVSLVEGTVRTFGLLFIGTGFAFVGGAFRNPTERRSKHMTGHKTTGANGSGSMTLYYMTPLFREMLRQWKETGKDVYFDMVVENDDQESSAGKQTVLLMDCNLDSVVLAKLDGDSDDALDEDADFTFEDFDILTPFTKF